MSIFIHMIHNTLRNCCWNYTINQRT